MKANKIPERIKLILSGKDEDLADISLRKRFDYIKSNKY